MRWVKIISDLFKFFRVNDFKIKKKKKGFLVFLFCVIFFYYVKVIMFLKKRIIGFFLKIKYEFYDCFSFG